MHTVLRIVFELFEALSNLAEILSSSLAHGPSADNFKLGVATVSSLVIAIFSGGVTIVGSKLALRRYEALRKLLEGMHIELRFREAMIVACPEAVTILGIDLRKPISYRGGYGLLQACLKGPDAVSLARKVDALLWKGEPFVSSARLSNPRTMSVRGCVVGGRAVIFLHFTDSLLASSALPAQGAAMPSKSGAIGSILVPEVLEALKSAVAIFGSDGRLCAHNEAFAAMWSLPTPWLRAGPTQSEFLDRLHDTRQLPEQRNYLRWKREKLESVKGGQSVEMVWHLPGDKNISAAAHRHFANGAIYTFEDISDRLALQRGLFTLREIQRGTLDTFNDAMAVFDADSCLQVYNDAFARLWRLSEVELSGAPHLAKLAELSELRLGRCEAWALLAAASDSDGPVGHKGWNKLTRLDQRTLAMSLTRLPMGATLATFLDLTALSQIASASSAKIAA